MPQLTEIAEEWRPVVGWEGLYEVSNCGRVRSIYRGHGSGRIINGALDHLGRRNLLLCRGPIRKNARAHTLVLTAFVGNKPAGMQCCHNDGNPSNNHISNLRWDTPKNNQADRIRHGTNLCGVQMHLAKLNPEKVREIRRKRAEGMTLEALGFEYGVDHAAIWLVAKGRTWRHVL